MHTRTHIRRLGNVEKSDENQETHSKKIAKNPLNFEHAEGGLYMFDFAKSTHHMIEYTKYSLRRFSKNIFSAALCFYQSHVFMVYKHRYKGTAKQLRKEVRRKKQFFRPSICLKRVV